MGLIVRARFTSEFLGFPKETTSPDSKHSFNPSTEVEILTIEHRPLIFHVLKS